ncbi:MAG: insulinase family protein [Lachnospiraceae bacterium]|nr:insulinase family protein [Lachnospiraceae bacterium]
MHMFDVVKKGIYLLEKEEALPEMNATGYILRHKKTKARVVVVTSKDKNKVFNIGFKTPPADDTGVPHILEHSVLCGSRNFPVKDPFVELVKGSLNTFLNAMTYSDKTVYPVASCNEKDFHNMMHVYLDAVFYPNIYKEPKIMMQEGWHYELDDPDGELTLNGVVYNEMKGVFSSADDVLMRRIQSALLKDTPYGFESGGDPEFIPDLTQEAFCAFHKKYYHPSNSYIYLYGDADMDKELQFIDEEYLSHFEYQKIDSFIPSQAPFAAPVYEQDEYSISEEEEEKDNTYLSFSTVIGTSLNKELYLAFQILGYVLFGMPGARIKKALLDAKIGKDVYQTYDNGIYQPTFSVVVNGSNPEEQEHFQNVLEEEFLKVVKEGLDEKVLRAAINYFEFKYKEADFGRFPKGLIYGLQMFDSWLYDDEKPFIHIKTREIFDTLKEKIGTGYFEDLIRQYLLENNHKAYVMILPKKGLTGVLEQKTKAKLQEYKESLSQDEIQKIIEDAAALKKYQEIPSTKEELMTIPLLSIDDIERKTEPLSYEEWKIEKTPVIFSKLFTNGIAYIRMVFSMKNLSEEMLPYAALLSSIYRLVDTENYTYQQLTTQINLDLGGWGTDTEILPTPKEESGYLPLFEISAKCLYDQLPNVFSMTREILFTSKIQAKDRLKEIISQMKTQLQMRNNQAGHSVAANRALSYLNEQAGAKELMEGITFYEFIKDLEENFEEKYDSLAAGLEKVRESIFTRDNFMISYTAESLPKEELMKQAEILCKEFYPAKAPEKQKIVPVVKNEGFKTSSKIQYVAKAGNFVKKGYSYTGALKVLQVIFSYDYLWQNVRVKGGAYGCMCGFSRYGSAFLTSYRDPNLSDTLEIYKKAWEFVRDFDADERDMTKFIIGAIGSQDAPVEPSVKGMQLFRAWLMGVDTKLLQKERDELLDTNLETIHQLAPLVQSAFEDDILCVIGNENRLEDEKGLFKELRSIF